MKKHFVTWMVCMLMAGLVLSGCNSGQPKNGESGKSKDPIKFTVFVGGSGVPTPDKDPILQQLNKDLNMDMEFIAVPNDYNQQLNVRIAGGTPPDVFMVSRNQMETYARQGMLLDLSSHLAKMPNVKQTYTEDLLQLGRVDGKLFTIPARPDIPGKTHWIRNDWLAKLGIQKPTTIEEFKKMLIAFTQDDPDGNGKKDTYGLTGNGLDTFGGLFSTFGVGNPGQYMITNNQVVYSTTAPEMRKALTFIAELVALKVVEPEIMANQGMKDREKAIKGLAGAIFKHWGDMGKVAQVQEYKSINPAAEFVQLDALTGPGGKFQGTSEVGQTPGRVAISKSLEKQPEKLAKILEYINYITDPGLGQLIVNYGIEGVHYVMENGKVKILPKASEVNYSNIAQLTRRNELQYLSAKFPVETPLIEFNSKQPRLAIYNNLISAPNGVVFEDKNRYETEEITKFIYGNRPLSEFDDFVKTLNDTYKLPLYIQEAEKTLKAAGYLK
jgi:putative aldouronate transport system substrate-binding protein